MTTTFDEIRAKAAENATVIPHRGTPLPESWKPTNRPQRRGGFYLIDGIDMPSVTTILNIINKPALIPWAAKQGAKAVIKDPILYDTPQAAAAAIYTIDSGEKATDRGKEAHTVAEAYAHAILKGTQDQFTSDNPYFKAIKAFFDQVRPDPLAIEVVLFNTEHQYAGTADLIAKVGDKLAIIDWKTSKFVFDEMQLQLVAYAHCDTGILIDGTRFATTYPDIQAIVLLRDNGTFLWAPLNGDFEAFLAAKRLWLWREGLNGD
jgi:genome maintenance exonuclease 1